jgi:hypothetical protein
LSLSLPLPLSLSLLYSLLYSIYLSISLSLSLLYPRSTTTERGEGKGEMEGARVLPPLNRSAETTSFIPSDFLLAHPARSSSALTAAPNKLNGRARQIAAQGPPSPLPRLASRRTSESEKREKRATSEREEEEEEEQAERPPSYHNRRGSSARRRYSSPSERGSWSGGAGVALLQRGLQGVQAEEAQTALRTALKEAQGPSQLRAVVEDQAVLADAYLTELAALVRVYETAWARRWRQKEPGGGVKEIAKRQR